MNGPKVVCAQCGGPTSVRNPICGSCLSGESGPPVDRCELCEQGYPCDRWGIHSTKAGGYVGKCKLAHATESPK